MPAMVIARSALPIPRRVSVPPETWLVAGIIAAAVFGVAALYAHTAAIAVAAGGNELPSSPIVMTNVTVSNP